MNKLFFTLIILISLNACGQTNKCNNKTIFKSNIIIPKEVCIPNDYIISYITKPLDLDNDGLNDFVCDYNKESLTDGDSIFVAIYLQREDSSFYLFKVLPNLYPIYFKDYSIERYNDLSSKLKSVMDRYDKNPLRGITYQKEQIDIEFSIDATETYTLVFIYSAQQQTWILKKKISYIGYNNETTVYDIESDEQIPIEEFNYLDWL